MFTRLIPRFAVAFALAVLVGLSLFAHAQDDEKHGRKYKAPPETAHIVVTVVKANNGKAIPNAAVIFHPVDKAGKDLGAMEIKSDPDGHASLDLIPVGSTVRLQILATGYSPYGADYDIPTNSKEILVKMLSPRAQVSAYEDNMGKAAPQDRGMQTKTSADVPAPQPQASAPAPKQ